MKILLVLFIAMAGQTDDDADVWTYEQKTIEQCLDNLNRYMTTRDVLDMEGVRGIGAQCQLTKEPERQG